MVSFLAGDNAFFSQIREGKQEIGCFSIAAYGNGMGPCVAGVEEFVECVIGLSGIGIVEKGYRRISIDDGRRSVGNVVAVGVHESRSVGVQPVIVRIVGREFLRPEINPHLVANCHAGLVDRNSGAPAGGDSDDAILRAGSVQRRRGSPLHDLYVFYIQRVDVYLAGSKHDPVDDIEGLGASRNAGRSAQPYGNAVAGLPALGDHAGARHLAVQAVQRAARRRKRHQVLIHLIYREGKFLPGRGFGDARYDDLVQIEKVLRQHEIRRRFRGRDDDAPGLGRISDVLHREIDRLRRIFQWDFERIPALGVG